MTGWRLTLAGPPIETASSFLQPVTRPDGTRAMLKLLKPASDEQNGGALLAYWAGEGAARAHVWDTGAQLLEWLDGAGALVDMVGRGEDDAASRIIAATVAGLHKRPRAISPASLIPLDRRFRSLFSRKHDWPILDRGATVARLLLAEPIGRAVLHGDIHHGNILRRADGAWVAIDPKGLVGEPTYDLANTLCNPVELPLVTRNRDRVLRQSAILADALGIDRRRLLAFAFAYACLSACWHMEGGGDPSYGLGMAEILEPLA